MYLPDIRPAPRLQSASETSTRGQASATTAANLFDIQETLDAGVQIFPKIPWFVVASKKVVG
jgi:hypothetical protein